MKDLTGKGFFSILRALFSVTTVALLLSETILGNLQTHIQVTGLALLSLSFMMLSWGIMKYLDGDRSRGLLGILGMGAFVLFVSVVNELLLRHS